MNYQDICPHDSCTGCMACLSSCAHTAIVLTEDSLGFAYPKIDTSKCVGCGLCEAVCPANHPVSRLFPQKCYALAGPEGLLRDTASGGAATVLSRHVTGRGGVVYGCSGEDIRDVRHIRIQSVEEISRLQGSKYVQSKTEGIFREVRKDLSDGRKVLFIGTPCQIGGLRNYLRRDWDNLITVDLVCHGVPSQRLLNENIDNHKKRYPRLVEDSVAFRLKKDFDSPRARISYGFYFRPAPGEDLKSIRWYDDPFMLGFLGAATMRTSCYECPYAYNVRASDLTLSDFWGLGRDAGFKSGRGVSSVLVNTSRGAGFWQEVLSALPAGIGVRERKIQESITGNGQLMCPTRRYPSVDLFRSLYPQEGLKKAIFKSLRRKRLKARLLRYIKSLKKLL
ncbi:MAG: Coenzyme F420 hydrogenase/dehydrogenase, beta subunit C-terminal domain [Duncaniella sp.]|nr:Coenzyme F420 hydrogenase/dehydrogenase, beta subunit C-terminal domain [Duncaniella sp.]